jgi:cyclin-dependent kinase 8/11
LQSRSYKAPEVLFGSRDYDAFALDLWALGATLAELFCPLIETTNAASDDDDWRFSDDEDVPPPPPPKVRLHLSARIAST